jgi:hypothetical protein
MRVEYKVPAGGTNKEQGDYGKPGVTCAVQEAAHPLQK